MESTTVESAETCVTCGSLLSPADPFCLVCALEWGLGGGNETAETPMEASFSKPDRLAYFGDYELISEIDRGGMGVVYKARQVSLNRLVAVKMILSGQLKDRRAIERFQQESRAAARLNHPHIVSIHEVGEHEGCPYFSMDYIEGEPLDRHALLHKLSPECIAEICETVAGSLQYAHDQGIVHRDIKPSNILMDRAGKPHVLDFGLAKEIERHSSVTLTGQILGSPNYISPEQISDRFGQVGKASDVYSLGAVLYQLLTGRPPFQGQDPAQTMHRVVTEDLVSPRLLNPLVPVDLETICLKALEKEPDRRLQSAAAFADELGRYLKGEPIQSRPLNVLEKGGRWCRRKPALAGVTLALLLSCLVGSLTVLMQWRQSRAHEVEAQRFLYAADMNLAHNAIQENNLGRAKDLLNRHRPLQGEAELQGWEWRYLSHLAAGDELATLGEHARMVTSVAYSPKGEQVVSGSYDGSIKVWDVGSRRLVHHRVIGESEGDWVWSVAYSPDGEVLATGTEDGRILLWDSQSMELKSTWTNHFRGMTLKYSPDGRWLGVGDSLGVHLWNVAEQNIAAEFEVEQNWRVNVGLAFSSDSRWLAYNQGGGGVGLYDLREREMQEPPFELGVPSTSLAFSPDQRFLASGGRSGLMRIWSLETRNPVRTMNEHTAWVGDVDFSLDGNWLISGSADQTLKLWDTETWECRSTLRGQLDEIWDFDLSPDGQTLVTGGKDDLVKLWALESRKASNRFANFPELMVVQPVLNRRQNFRLSPDGSQALSWVDGGRYTTWNTASLTEETTWPFPEEVQAVTAGAIRDSRIAFAGRGGSVDLVDSKTNRVIDRLDTGMTTINGILFSAKSDRMVVANHDGELKCFETTNHRLIYRDALPEYEIFSLAVSEDGKHVAVGFYNGTLVLYSVDAQERFELKKYHRDQIGALAFSSDNRLLATASADGSVKLLRVTDRAVASHFVARLSGFFSVGFSLDNRRVLAGSGNGQAKMWDVSSEQELLTLQERRIDGPNAVRYLRLLPDGETLLLVRQGGWVTWRAPAFTELLAGDIDR